MKVAIIGLDGATWNVLNHLINQNFLPTFKILINKGVRATLESTIPPITGAAWLSIATGLSPGETGVIDFLKLNSDHTLSLVNAIDFRRKAIWDILGNKGVKVGIIDYPMLYPAYPVNGFMLSSWGSVPSSYPSSILKEINNLVKNYDIFVDYHLEKYNNLELFFNDLNYVIEKKLKVSLHLLNNKNWNLFIDVISFTDWLQHRLWHYIDSAHPYYSNGAKAERVYKKFIGYWQQIDNYLKQIISNIDYLFIVSDHGFGSQWGVFNLAKWLETKGLLVRKKIKLKTKLFAWMLHSLSKHKSLIKLLPKKIYYKGRKKFTNISHIFSQIDFNLSKVMVLGHTIPVGALYINPKFRDKVNEIMSKIDKELSRLNRELGKNIKVNTFKLKEIYPGDNSDKLPDLLLSINDWSCVFIKDFMKEFIYLEETYSPRHTGSHRRNGIFLAYGKDIRQNLRVEKISLFDIAPTILHLFNQPIPKNVKGTVLKSIFEENSEYKKRKIEYTEIRYSFRKRSDLQIQMGIERVKKKLKSKIFLKERNNY